MSANKREIAHEQVAKNLYRLRNERGLSQEKLCELADIDRTFYQRVESRKKNMSVEYLDRVRRVLKCRWADLFEGLDDAR